LLHPGTGRGSQRFLLRDGRSRGPKTVWSGASGASPSAPSHPSKKSPLQQPFHVAVAVASSPLALQHVTVAGAAWRPSTSRPCSAVGSVATAAVADVDRPLLPWASFPSRVLAGTGLRPDASPHRPGWTWLPPAGTGVATDPCRLPRSRDRPPVLPTLSFATSLPPIRLPLSPAALPARSLSEAARSRSVRRAVEPKLAVGRSATADPRGVFDVKERWTCPPPTDRSVASDGRAVRCR
jgi:hypothetical protein